MAFDSFGIFVFSKVFQPIVTYWPLLFDAFIYSTKKKKKKSLLFVLRIILLSQSNIFTECADLVEEGKKYFKICLC